MSHHARRAAIGGPGDDFRFRLSMLQITNLTFNAWGRQFLDDASVSLPPGSKVGLIGRNGIGKTTLLGLIAGRQAPQSGAVAVQGRVGMLHQTVQVRPDESVIDLFGARRALAALRRAEQEIGRAHV